MADPKIKIVISDEGADVLAIDKNYGAIYIGSDGKPHNSKALECALLAHKKVVEQRLRDFSLAELHAESRPDAVTEPPDDHIPVLVSPVMLSEKTQEQETARRVFSTVAEAFASYGKRMLLLGEPGAGKTTIYLKLLKQALEERINETSAPLPVYAAFDRWDGSTSLSDWLEQRKREIYPNLNLQSEENFLYLLDGLDEVRPSPLEVNKGSAHETEKNNNTRANKADPRKQILSQLHDAVGYHSILLTCRVQDYQEMQTRAVLPGAVRLLPLDDAQIRHFLLETAPRPRLWATLEEDYALLELARTPLLLTLLASIAGPEDTHLNLKSRTASEVFDAYISARFKYEQSRIERSIKSHSAVLPFDQSTTRRYLGRIAAKMWHGASKENIFWSLSNMFVRQRLNKTEIVEALGDKADTFLQFACAMNFLRQDGDDFVFLHLKLRDYCAVDGLVEILEETRLPHLRTAWERRKSTGWLKALLYTLTDALQAVNVDRSKSAQLLAKIGDTRAVDALIKALRDKDPFLRSNAAEALGTIGDTRAVPGLVETLHRKYDRRSYEDHFKVYLRSEPESPARDDKALRRVDKARRRFDKIISHEEARKSAATALGQIGDVGAADELAATLHDKYEWVGLREAAAVALGKIADARSVAELTHALATERPVKRAAAK